LEENRYTWGLFDPVSEIPIPNADSSYSVSPDREVSREYRGRDPYRQYVVNADVTSSGSFKIIIRPPNSNTVLVEAADTVQGVRMGGSDRD
jgi:hypothetical protein